MHGGLLKGRESAEDTDLQAHVPQLVHHDVAQWTPAKGGTKVSAVQCGNNARVVTECAMSHALILRNVILCILLAFINFVGSSEARGLLDYVRVPR